MSRILLGVTGGIAAYKACELTRLLVKAGHEVIPLLTRGAQRFVTEETFLALSDLVRQGKIRYVGTSEWNAEQLLRAAAAAERYSVPFIVNETHYSMSWRGACRRFTSRTTRPGPTSRSGPGTC